MFIQDFSITTVKDGALIGFGLLNIAAIIKNNRKLCIQCVVCVKGRCACVCVFVYAQLRVCVCVCVCVCVSQADLELVWTSHVAGGGDL